MINIKVHTFATPIGVVALLSVKPACASGLQKG